MPAQINGTYTLANGDKLFISALTETLYNTTKHNHQAYAGTANYINNVELQKTNGVRVDITELVIEFDKDSYLIDKCI
jgi:hypothetical protein